MATRIRLASLGATVLTVGLLLTGCGGDSTAGPRAPQTSDSPTAPSAPYTVNPAEAPVHPTNIPKPNKNQKIPTLCNENTKPFTGPVAEEWGPDKVMDAYCELIDFTANNQITGLIEKTLTQQEVRDYEFLTPYMTPETAKDFRADVAKVLAAAKKDEGVDEYARIAALTLPSVENMEGYTFFKNGPYAVGYEASGANIETVPLKSAVGMTPSLRFTFSTKTNLYMQNDKGEPFTKAVTGEQTFWVVNSASDSRDWLIADWQFHSGNYGPMEPYKPAGGKS